MIEDKGTDLQGDSHADFSSPEEKVKNFALIPLATGLGFAGPFAIDRFSFNVTEVGYLYANIGIAVSLGHLFLTRRLANRYSSEQSLIWSLLCLAILLAMLMFSSQVIILNVMTFLVMLACAVAYTNSMALVSNQANQEQQGEIMGVAVSIQSCAEFLPAAILGLIASISQVLPLVVAALLACSACLICYKLSMRFLVQDT